MGMLEARESAARVRVEELRAEADRVRAELAEAEAVLERRVVALRELAEALAAGAVPQEPVRPAPVPAQVKEPVAGSVVPERREGVTAQVLAPEYRRLLAVLEAGSAGAGLRAKDLAARLGLELVPAKVEGVRVKAKRLVARGWLVEDRPGLFKVASHTLGTVGRVAVHVREAITRPGGRVGRSKQRHGRLLHQGLLLLMDFDTHELCRRPCLHARQASEEEDPEPIRPERHLALYMGGGIAAFLASLGGRGRHAVRKHRTATVTMTAAASVAVVGAFALTSGQGAAPTTVPSTTAGRAPGRQGPGGG
ncbi:hypothetical protein [Streptomyces peucetius]|uniref:hypothetical protein n=1 Tax=Streptomyces peucetius TaxID=1950 RepID=UPI00299F584D|nr:hypothetical protein [Streptomyces peucetius]